MGNISVLIFMLKLEAGVNTGFMLTPRTPAPSSLLL